VLRHCWLDHLTRKIVSKMTYNVSSGTLNPTIPYYTIKVTGKDDHTHANHLYNMVAAEIEGITSRANLF